MWEFFLKQFLYSHINLESKVILIYVVQIVALQKKKYTKQTEKNM